LKYRGDTRAQGFPDVLNRIPLFSLSSAANAPAICKLMRKAKERFVADGIIPAPMQVRPFALDGSRAARAHGGHAQHFLNEERNQQPMFP
jgi:hypothetical protein